LERRFFPTRRSSDLSRVVLKVIAGMTGTLPKVGDEPIFSVYTTSWVPPAVLPPETPWTHVAEKDAPDGLELDDAPPGDEPLALGDRKSTRLNSSHVA